MLVAHRRSFLSLCPVDSFRSFFFLSRSTALSDLPCEGSRWRDRMLRRPSWQPSVGLTLLRPIPTATTTTSLLLVLLLRPYNLPTRLLHCISLAIFCAFAKFRGHPAARHFPFSPASRAHWAHNSWLLDIVWRWQLVVAVPTCPI